MPRIHVDYSEPARFVGCYFIMVLFGPVRSRLARCEAWFSPEVHTRRPEKVADEVPDPRPPLRDPRLAVPLGLWASAMLAINSDLLVHHYRAFRTTLVPNEKGDVHIGVMELLLLLLVVILLHTSLRALCNIYRGMREPMGTVSDEQEHDYRARVYMLDGVWAPLLLLAYGDEKCYAHALQCIVWALFFTWSLYASQGFSFRAAGRQGGDMSLKLETV